jgi:hypothetical protein
MNRGQRILSLEVLAGLTVSMLLFACGIPVWALPTCRVLVVFAGQTASITIGDKTLNFKYESAPSMVTVWGEYPGSDSFPPTVGGTLWCSVWGDCTTIAVTPYFVVFFLRPLSVLKLMGIEHGF